LAVKILQGANENLPSCFNIVVGQTTTKRLDKIGFLWYNIYMNKKKRGFYYDAFY
jgi:hypothetical protein